MLKKSYGSSDLQISAIGFGGMRFDDASDIPGSAATVLHAHGQGVTYFDTAPGYCQDKSEDIMGHALRQLPRESYVISTKCGQHEGKDVRASIERSCERLGVECIDCFNIWCLMSADDFEARKKAGAIEAAQQAKADGLIERLVCSSHMPGDQLAAVLEEGIFEGVTLGYNAVNFPYREAAIECAGRKGLGVVCMNPLGGGLIPQNPERFSMLAEGGSQVEDVVAGALRFVVSQASVSCALVGFSNPAQVDQAVAAMRDWTCWQTEQRQALAEQLGATFDDLCTGCGYCEPCPAGIPIPKMMDAWNQVILSGGNTQTAINRFKWHWRITEDHSVECTECGRCEELCTQHLPIIERLKALPDPS